MTTSECFHIVWCNTFYLLLSGMFAMPKFTNWHLVLPINLFVFEHNSFLVRVTQLSLENKTRSIYSFVNFLVHARAIISNVSIYNASKSENYLNSIKIKIVIVIIKSTIILDLVSFLLSLFEIHVHVFHISKKLIGFEMISSW